MESSDASGCFSTERFARPRSAVYGVFLASVALLAACTTAPRLPDPLEAGWEGASVCETLHDDAEHRILRCTFPPGVGHERHYHDRHFGYTLAGARMRITDANGVREMDVPTDSGFASDGIEWHEVINVGDTTGVFLIIEPK
ncbi:cupin domain-containing protein [Wenzhouxiangella sp. XN79A]|uniref:cupin domain-containing protein n=1 Tax=Wenzhouxiangella sp. XN79A TaxID=2724193 RepID=UPI00144AF9BB|nr:cupin domain-containing protein [Wenzhouxiangella sp. XN79A]NKI36386.1 cupin domain-containing protein [Wenzhouxiangella sp. XN79A]